MLAPQNYINIIIKRFSEKEADVTSVTNSVSGRGVALSGLPDLPSQTRQQFQPQFVVRIALKPVAGLFVALL